MFLFFLIVYSKSYSIKNFQLHFLVPIEEKKKKVNAMNKMFRIDN